ncbi:transcriptional corepressor LEUNIG [Actinidia rufa]|uniref:Transcriptional corepressor LEUNIG n=1 Tax=Actinidia rufa TaxID=165716 RepID=A0A7J0EY58_9ERIC|nr:transcriptional corepressor LEUNIG [Actinidia rufa]
MQSPETVIRKFQIYVYGVLNYLHPARRSCPLYCRFSSESGNSGAVTLGPVSNFKAAAATGGRVPQPLGGGGVDAVAVVDAEAAAFEFVVALGS